MLRQIIAGTAVALQNLPARWGASLVVVVSTAGVTGVMVAMLAMAHGFRETIKDAGRPNRAVILGTGLDNGTASAISREQLPIVLDAPGIARDADGRPLAVAQKFMVSELRRRGSGEEAGLQLRGVSAQAFEVWPEVTIVEGHAFTPGKREVIAGRGAVGQFEGVELGREVELVNGPWTVVGIFAADGAVYESELWGDVEMVFPGFSITGHFSSVTAVLESEAALATLSDFIKSNPKLNNAAKRETDYYAEQSGGISELMRMLGYGVAGIMALGALFAAVNTMYAAVRTRMREIGTMRAIGFGAVPVVASVLLEAIALCVAGALVGGGVAFAFFDGHTVSTINGQTGGQVAFAFRVTSAMIGQGVAAALLLGLLGGLLPAIRAARLPVAEALRRA